MKPTPIAEFPLKNGLPEPDEFVCPIVQENLPHNITSKINIPDLCDYIKDYVTKGGEVEVIESELGLKFIKR